MIRSPKITILGAGSFGLTLAWLWQKNNLSVTVWDYKQDKINQLQQAPQISNPLQVNLSSDITFETDLRTACQEANIIVLAVTSKGTQSISDQLVQLNLSDEVIFLNVSKGIVSSELKRASEIIQSYFPNNPVAVLSGPCLAKEILQGLPTAATVASDEINIAENLMQYLSVEAQLRLYANTDLLGVELGGALKNIYAIGSGYLHQNNLGENALAAYLTRSLAELTRFALSQGAKPETLFGLSGLGDLLATCHSPNSRNYQLGQQLAKGLKLPEALQVINGPAEGVETTFALIPFLKQQQVEMPIASVVNQLLTEPLSVKEMLNLLMMRKLKLEV